jgi:hypothetical protein
MTVTRRPLTRDDLAPLARAAVGPARTLTGTARLRGGTKKGAHRLFNIQQTVMFLEDPDRI